MGTKVQLGKRVFLSATYEDQEDCIEEIKSMLAEQGIAVLHFKGGDFYNGRIGVHPHDLCLQNVENTPNYLLILGYKAGANYQGDKVAYHGLTVTHAEFRTALEASAKDENRRSFFYVRQRVADTYGAWKSLSEKEREGGSWLAELKIYRLLEEMEQKRLYRYTFTNSRHLKDLIGGALPHFVTESKTPEEIINVDTILSYIRDKYPDRPPTPQQDLILVTLELGRYGCQTIPELDAKLRKTEKAFAELEKELKQHGVKGIHGGGVIRNSLWVLDDDYYQKRMVGFSGEKVIDRKRFRHLI